MNRKDFIPTSQARLLLLVICIEFNKKAISFKRVKENTFYFSKKARKMSPSPFTVHWSLLAFYSSHLCNLDNLEEKCFKT
jgi:hypothetical protein